MPCGKVAARLHPPMPPPPGREPQRNSMRMAMPARWALALSTLVACSALTAGAPASVAAPSKDPGPELAPVIGTERETAIDGQYIVVLEGDATQRDATTA